MNTEQPTPPAVVLSTALLERLGDLAAWFCDNPNRDDIKDALTVLVRDVAFAEREACAKLVAPKTPRPCACESCDCGNKDDAQKVAEWDAENLAATAIRLRSNSLM